MSCVPSSRFFAGLVGCTLAGCSSSSSPGVDSGTPDTSIRESGKDVTADVASDAGPDTALPFDASFDALLFEAGPGPEAAPEPTLEAGPDAGADSACAGTALTVINANEWCSVTVGSNPAFLGRQETFCVMTGSTVPLSATARPGFTLASMNWHDETGVETVSGGVASTTETATGPTACVWVCCPGDTPADPCPTIDQCM
jgi:hypothetical protein